MTATACAIAPTATLTIRAGPDPEQGPVSMELEALIGRYSRLKQELSIAYRTWPWHVNLIDRLAEDLAATERDITTMRSAREAGNASAPEATPLDSP